MPQQQWFTNPNDPFSSFYLYDTDSRDFVRIRLELNRKDKGAPIIIPYKDRYVGFINPTGKYDYEDLAKWTVNKLNHKIEYNGVELGDSPTDGKKIVDFSLPEGNGHPTSKPHHGKAVTSSPNLPHNSAGELVTTEMLEAIAEVYLGKTKKRPICQYNASEVLLGDAIFEIYNEIIK